MKLLIVLLFDTVLCYPLSDEAYQYFLLVSYPGSYWLKIIALIIIHSSLLWIAISQMQMSNSWRIGIDQVNKTDRYFRYKS